MPMQRELYPSNWEAIALAKKQASEWKCEVCGKQCRKPGEPFMTHKDTLTVAHLDHNPANCAGENLKAMCAPCHLRYDAIHHAETRKRRRTNMSAIHDGISRNIDKLLKRYPDGFDPERSINREEENHV